ncbi:copper resistance protein NlpE [Bordetella sp. 15P40C-2]|nr:copper resistance protein NlpE [Bordetella sp. 15P40C-2]
MKIRASSVFLMTALLSACAPVPQTGAAFDAEHNARTALDWAGTYRGVLPCADCEGIDTVVTLEDDGSYQTIAKYLGKRNAVSEERGRFGWNAAGNTVTLGQREPVQYFVAENRLIRLATDGSRINGPLADSYVLTKE